MATLAVTIEEALEQQRARITSEFSLDAHDSALSRLVREIVDSNGKLRKDFQQDLAGVVAQFSLDDRDSGLSRSVAQGDRASREIAEQFSLDIDDSSLNRLRREFTRGLEELTKSQPTFQAEVRATPVS